MEERVRYRTVLAHREFRALFAAQTLSLLGDQLARIALAILVYRRTGSTLQSSATFAVSYLAYLVGGPLLSGLADRYPRLTVMVTCDLVRVPVVLALCLTTLPLWVVFVLIGVLGAAGPPFDSARSALQPDVLEGEAYVVGNTLMNVCGQISQILGFVLGGAIVALTSVRGALALDAATFLVSAGVLLHGVRPRPPAQTELGTFFRDTLQGLGLVARSARLRRLLQFAVLASVSVTATEGLAVAVADELGHGAVMAGVLTATVPTGFLLASGLVLRVPSAQREGLLPWLVLLSTVPLLATGFLHSVVPLVLLWALAGAGATANLVAGPAFVQSCPAEFRGRAYGIATACLMTAQGLGLLASGWLGTVFSPRTAVAVVAALMLVLAFPVMAAQGMPRTIRNVHQ
ncbi:MAG TPA: MFS transporter [Mycobacteriales bacterium]|nr:MFS transporter [Mycobacteriales bacterium]